MKKMMLLFSVILFTVVSNSSFGQETQQGMDEGMKTWMEFMTPGPMHEILAKGAGDWKVKSTFWMYPGAEPQVTDGTAKGEMILGGRYLRVEQSTTVMGMPMNGVSLEGFDNAKEIFVSTWIDNMGSGISFTEGKYDAEKKMINYEGKMTDPMTKSDAKFRQTTEWTDDGKIIIKMYGYTQGVEYQNMEAIFSK
ncbi:MAG: DUF1579 domain-containing protein [bacterium]